MMACHQEQVTIKRKTCGESKHKGKQLFVIFTTFACTTARSEIFAMLVSFDTKINGEQESSSTTDMDYLWGNIGPENGTCQKDELEDMHRLKRLPNIGTLATRTHGSAYGNCKPRHLNKLQKLNKSSIRLLM